MNSYCDIYRDDIFGPTTLGKMYLNGKYHCETLEDEVRPFGNKINGQTAIYENPIGYKMTLTYSERFKRVLPIIYTKVENGQYILEYGGIRFVGIRMHGGNTKEDTEGCILCAELRINDTTIQNCKKKVNDLCQWIEEQETMSNEVICRVFNKIKPNI